MFIINSALNFVRVSVLKLIKKKKWKHECFSEHNRFKSKAFFSYPIYMWVVAYYCIVCGFLIQIKWHHSRLTFENTIYEVRVHKLWMGLNGFSNKRGKNEQQHNNKWSGTINKIVSLQSLIKVNGISFCCCERSIERYYKRQDHVFLDRILIGK